MGEFMDYEMLVNKDNTLDKTYVPLDLVDASSSYKDGILKISIIRQEAN